MGEKNLRFVQVGLGSMGKRRIANLEFHKVGNIVGVDSSEEKRKEAEEKYKIKTYASINEVSPDSYDAMIISTPPASHGDYIRKAINLRKHFFTEVATSDDGYSDAIGDKSDIVKAPSNTFRYFLPLVTIKKFLEKGRIGKSLAFNYHMGQYLPDWHPWEDYREVYFSKKETSATREMFPFELGWLSWLFDTKPLKVTGFVGKVSDLEMEADDLISATISFDSKLVGNLLIDVISRKAFRTLRILGSDGVLEWEWLENRIKIYNAETKKTEEIKIPKGNPKTGYLAAEEMYQDEIGAFLDAIDGKIKYPYTFKEDQKILQVLYDLEGKQK